MEAVDDIGGQLTLPQARSVGQQPPPREDAQDRNPEEHVKISGIVDVVEVTTVVVVVETELVNGGGALVMEEKLGSNGAEDVGVTITVAVVVGVEGVGVDVTVGVTKTVAVEFITQPTSRHA